MEFRNKGNEIYTPLILKIYDAWVLGISNRYAWRCRTDKILLRHFQRHMGDRHLDIGVGTGFYIANIKDGSNNVTLVDVNSNSLNFATKRIGRHRINRILQHDICHPLPDGENEQYDSVSMYYVLHCLQGGMNVKSSAIGHAARALTQNGTLHGATILGQNAGHNGFGRYLMRVYNRKGIFSNLSDSCNGLRSALEKYFDNVVIYQYGVVVVFNATQKKFMLPKLSYSCR